MEPAAIDRAGPRRKDLLPAAVLFPLAGLALFLLHAPVLDLPYFWDELGYYVPAALDFYERGILVPQSTSPNTHPPGLTLWLALVWKLAGCSIPVTRAAMLLVAAAGVAVVYLLAADLAGGASRGPAWASVLFLLACPLFYTQAMMAQIDMPAMLLVSLALLLFLRNRLAWSLLACVALVLVRETAVAAPLVLAAWLAHERRRRAALLFLVPAALLGAWFLELHLATREWFGDREFTRVNVLFPLHPVRLPAAALRRFSWLFLENFHAVGTLAIALAALRTDLYRSRAWRVTLLTGGALAASVTLLGGAALERYLMPVVPLFYIAAAAALAAWPRRLAQAAAAVMLAGLAVSHFVNPPLFAFPFENNLAMVDFVRLHQAAAAYLEERNRGEETLTAWPLTDALRRPEFGYVKRSLPVRAVADFSAAAIGRTPAGGTGWFVLYSREIEPRLSLSRIPALASLRRAYWGWEPPVTGHCIESRYGMRPVARWERRGQWIEIYRRAAASAR